MISHVIASYYFSPKHFHMLNYLIAIIWSTIVIMPLQWQIQLSYCWNNLKHLKTEYVMSLYIVFWRKRGPVWKNRYLYIDQHTFYHLFLKIVPSSLTLSVIPIRSIAMLKELFSVSRHLKLFGSGDKVLLSQFLATPEETEPDELLHKVLRLVLLHPLLPIHLVLSIFHLHPLL